MSSFIRTMRCRSSAKINLTLDVLSRRDDGYHELQSIVHTVGLYDSLRFDFAFDSVAASRRANQHELSLQCDQTALQTDDNLCLKAARLWLAAAHDATDQAAQSGARQPGDSSCAAVENESWAPGTFADAANAADKDAAANATGDAEVDSAFNARSDDASLDAKRLNLANFVGARITLEKAIPHGAGLGGGSGNAAATLLAFNRSFDDLLSPAQMHHLALRLGADVPFFLRGGCALMEGIGEKLSDLPAQSGWLLLAQPDVPLSTPRVFKAWDALGETSARATQALKTLLDKPRIDSVEDASTAQLQMPFVERNRLFALAKLLHNDLARAAQGCGAPVAETAEILRHGGALETCMTGSGSAVFGVFESEAETRNAFHSLARDAVASGLRLAFSGVVPLCARGVEFDDTPA